jgi:hypothetical protein
VSTDCAIRRALDALTDVHGEAPDASRERLTAIGTALARGATEEQVQAAMGGLTVRDALVAHVRGSL